jgi:methionyl-tRNA formyltransferase
MPLRIVVCGTGPFAVPTFETLLESSHPVAALITRPIADPGQRRKLAANPMREAATRHGIAVHEPADINAPDAVELIRTLQPDLLVVCDYGQILSREVLAVAPLGGINLHGSLLPRYRGAAPVAWAIWRGETVTGVSVIHMTGQLDGGPVLAAASLAIGPDETCAELEPRLAQAGVAPVLDAVRQLEEWDRTSPIGKPQDPSLATRARRLRKEDAVIRWDRPARKIHRQVRALQPWPGTWTTWQRTGQAEAQRLIVLRTTFVSSQAGAGGEVHRADTTGTAPGRIIVADGKRLVVQTGSGVLALLEVQPAGKRSMPVADFLRGNPLRPGDRLGAAP